MPIQRSISRIVTPGPAVEGCAKLHHSFIEVIQTDDFINTARLYLDGARKLLRGTTDLAIKAEQIVAPTAPTQ